MDDHNLDKQPGTRTNGNHNSHSPRKDDSIPQQVRRNLTQRASSGRSGAALTVSIVIPTLNEVGNIVSVLKQLGQFDDIVLVDGFSDDGTVELALRVRPDITVIQRKPRGKGDALRAGFALATGDVIVMMDADGSMDPAEVHVFTSMIALGFDLVKGSRLACGGGSHDLTVIRWMGNAALCRLANALFGTDWTDLCYGYLALRRSCVAQLGLTADGFEIESQILVHAALAGLRIAEIPSVELPRLTGDSHLNARRDGLRIARTMLAARLAPRARRSAAALRPVVARASGSLETSLMPGSEFESPGDDNTRLAGWLPPTGGVRLETPQV